MRHLAEVLRGSLFCFVLVGSLSAQETTPDRSPGSGNGFELQQNYPNPFNPETTIPFTLSEDLFVNGRPVIVTIRIMNLLQQVIASPVALGHSMGGGAILVDLNYAQAGRYEAFWDGTDQSERHVASGIYFVQLTVNGLSRFRKMYVLK